VSRSLGGAGSEVVKALGTEPIFIIEVVWGDKGNPTAPTLSYADRDFDGVDGKILEVSGLDAIIKLGTTGVTTSISIVLDDTDGSIKTILDTNDVHKSSVRVYQTYGALDAVSKFLLFAGIIETPIDYSEADRSISLDVVSLIEDREIGFSPEEGDAEFLSPDAIGVPWPLCFGNVVRVPAAKLTDRLRGSSLTNYGAVSLGDLDDLCARAASFLDATSESAGGSTCPGTGARTGGLSSPVVGLPN